MDINWGFDYVWGLPIIVLTVVIHVYGLGSINKVFASALTAVGRLRDFPIAALTIPIGGTVLSVTILHALESSIWAGAYRFIGALPDNRSAMLYSLNAMTSYGHENLNLSPRWQLMGALEALDGWILFGLTTAFLFTVMQKVWSRSEPRS